MTTEEVIRSAVGVILPIGFVALIFFARARVYASWAKVASIIVCVAGLGGEISDFLLLRWRTIHLTPQAYYLLVGVRGALVGLAIGLAVSILLARPYRKSVDKPHKAEPSKSGASCTSGDNAQNISL
ncbi:MAG: hypothetical protein DME76_07090 [Verrucomicrobia bacterium]|nr:MAG: hypothetical protein DME76_07090 [Verrucomicrobiota bacterium]